MGQLNPPPPPFDRRRFLIHSKYVHGGYSKIIYVKNSKEYMKGPLSEVGGGPHPISTADNVVVRVFPRPSRKGKKEQNVIWSENPK